MGLDIGDVGHPNPIRGIDLELLLQLVLSNNSGLATVSAWTTSVADLCNHPSEAGKTRHAVLRAALALIPQIIMQLAVSVDFATVRPSLTDQVCLPCIFQRTMA